jgi:hypothetical protein
MPPDEDLDIFQQLEVFQRIGKSYQLILSILAAYRYTWLTGTDKQNMFRSDGYRNNSSSTMFQLVSRQEVVLETMDGSDLNEKLHSLEKRANDFDNIVTFDPWDLSGYFFLYI